MRRIVVGEIRKIRGGKKAKGVGTAGKLRGWGEQVKN